MLRKSRTRVRRLSLLISLFSILTALGIFRSSASSTTGLVTKLTGDFVGVDAVGDNDLTLVGGAAVIPGGSNGPAFSFDGIAGYAKVNSQTYSLSGGTVSLWFLSRNPQARGVITGSYGG